MQVINKLLSAVISFLDGIPFTRHKISLWAVGKEFVKEFSNDDVPAWAQAMAYNFFLAIFPGIIFLFTLIPYIPIEGLQDNIMLFLEQSLPKSIYDLISDTIFDIVSKPRGGLLSFGFVLALYAATSGTGAMINAFNHCYRTDLRKRSFFQAKFTEISLTLILVLVLVASVFLLNVGEYLLSYGHEIHIVEDYILDIIGSFRYAVLVFMFLCATSFIYYLGPSLKQKWGFFSYGAVLATGLNMLVSVGFAIYINNFASYNKLYGSIGTIIALMLWFYLTSMVLLIGYEFNAAIDSLKQQKIKSANEAPPI